MKDDRPPAVVLCLVPEEQDLDLPPPLRIETGLGFTGR